MREFSHDKALTREHDQFLSVTAAVYLGGGLLFLLAVPLILRFECPFESITKLGWVEFFLWLVALLYSAHCAKSRKGVFRLLDQWEQSLLRREKDLEALAAHRTVEEHDGVFVWSDLVQQENRRTCKTPVTVNCATCESRSKFYTDELCLNFPASGTGANRDVQPRRQPWLLNR
jgi:hypothetical protein